MSGPVVDAVREVRITHLRPAEVEAALARAPIAWVPRSQRYIEKLAPNVQVIYLPSGQEYLIPLPQPADALPNPTTVITP